MTTSRKQLEHAQREADFAYYGAWAAWTGGPIPELKHTLQLRPMLYNVEHPFWEAMRGAWYLLFGLAIAFGFPILLLPFAPLYAAIKANRQPSYVAAGARNWRLYAEEQRRVQQLERLASATRTY